MAVVDDKPADEAATVIIGQRVREGCEAEFEAWQTALNDAAGRYPGFLAAAVTPPTAVQPEW
ncbi:MAG: putative rane protein, partial [Pseudonocardia sp.]|nr:putative rane protein [Pseudonocardia sp.]